MRLKGLLSLTCSCVYKKGSICAEFWQYCRFFNFHFTVLSPYMYLCALGFIVGTKCFTVCTQTLPESSEQETVEISI